MNKTELIAAVAEKASISKKDADSAVNAVIDTIVEALAAEEKVQLVGFGTFESYAQRSSGPRSQNEFPDHHSGVQGSRLQGRQGVQGFHREISWSMSGLRIDQRVCAPSAAFFFVREVKRMRLDKYLKVSRLIKRRTVANEACDAGRSWSTANLPVRRMTSGGIFVEVQLGARTLKVRVLSVSEYAKKEEAGDLYEFLA